ncbi:MAG: YlxR family protein [Clostridiales bacterium]|nr:YlxR family protein [Clostridiales bacterium]
MKAKKKVPVRKCLGCGEQKAKKELVRVVRTPEGAIVLDLTGKKSGRGAYICPNKECFRKARRGKRFEKSLEVPISAEVYEVIERELDESGE